MRTRAITQRRNRVDGRAAPLPVRRRATNPRESRQDARTGPRRAPSIVSGSVAPDTRRTTDAARPKARPPPREKNFDKPREEKQKTSARGLGPAPAGVKRTHGKRLLGPRVSFETCAEQPPRAWQYAGAVWMLVAWAVGHALRVHGGASGHPGRRGRWTTFLEGLRRWERKTGFRLTTCPCCERKICGAGVKVVVPRLAPNQVACEGGLSRG